MMAKVEWRRGAACPVLPSASRLPYESESQDMTRKRKSDEQLIADLEARIRLIQERMATRSARSAEQPKAKRRRFSAQALARHRAKLEISAADYARLVGVSAVTIYNWEKGIARPQARQDGALSAVRRLGKREAWRRLDELAD